MSQVAAKGPDLAAQPRGATVRQRERVRRDHAWKEPLGSGVVPVAAAAVADAGGVCGAGAEGGLAHRRGGGQPAEEHDAQQPAAVPGPRPASATLRDDQGQQRAAQPPGRLLRPGARRLHHVLQLPGRRGRHVAARPRQRDQAGQGVRLERRRRALRQLPAQARPQLGGVHARLGHARRLLRLPGAAAARAADAALLWQPRGRDGAAVVPRLPHRAVLHGPGAGAARRVRVRAARYRRRALPLRVRALHRRALSRGAGLPGATVPVADRALCAAWRNQVPALQLHRARSRRERSGARSRRVGRGRQPALQGAVAGWGQLQVHLLRALRRSIRDQGARKYAMRPWKSPKQRLPHRHLG